MSKELSREARIFWLEQVGTKVAGTSVHELEGFEEVMHRLLDGLTPDQRLDVLVPEQWLGGLPREQWVAGLTPDQRLAGLALAEWILGIPLALRVAGLGLKQAILALPDEVLRGFSEEHLQALSEPARVAIRERIGR